MQRQYGQINSEKRLRKRVTISDVSAELGLTKGTVSRALNGYSDISDGTKKRVIKAAETMGYQPLSHAQAIRTGRTRSLGLVLQMNDHDSQRPFLAGFLSGISHITSRENWTLTVAMANSVEDTLATTARILGEQKADGFILPRTMRDDMRVKFLRDSETPFVLYGRTHDPKNCAWFDIRGEDAMADAVNRLAGMGHTRIAFVNGGSDYYYSHLRLAGIMQGLAAVGLPFDPELVDENAVRSIDGQRAAETMLALKNPPTAFIFALDMAALGLYPVAKKYGLTIGKDLSVIGYDGIPEGDFAPPALTTVLVDVKQADERLASLLIRRIRGEDVSQLRETARARLVKRGSDGPLA